jgi:hypothetical protein
MSSLPFIFLHSHLCYVYEVLVKVHHFPYTSLLFSLLLNGYKCEGDKIDTDYDARNAKKLYFPYIYLGY